jgi:hypothetical protein
MSSDLFLKYNASDTGARPLPTNSNFWQSPAVVLATPDGNYTVTTPPTPTTIDVQVSLMSPAAYEIINVEVWVCDPTTVAGPSTALAPFQGALASQKMLTGFYVPPTPSDVISTLPVIHVTGFAPYPGISSLPAGHCCLIANCYGTTSEGMADGIDLNEVAAANLPNKVQTDPHVAQHNIFADITSPGPHIKMINFPFRAATPLRAGAEQVTLQIGETPPAQLRTILHSGLLQVKGSGLSLEISDRPVKFIGLTGPYKEERAIELEIEAHESHRHKEARAVELELEAHKSRVLTATVELDPAERPGAAHAFDIVQRDAHGKAQGAFTLVTIRG